MPYFIAVLCLSSFTLHAAPQGLQEDQPRADIDAEEFVRALQPAPKVRSFPAKRGPQGVRDDYPSVSLLVHFDTDSDVILPASHASLREIARALRGELADMVLVVAGHTDDDGSHDYNLLLALRRAQAVRRFLVDEGVDGRRLRVETYGKTRPVADNAGPAGKARNRRVEFIRVGRVVAGE